MSPIVRPAPAEYLFEEYKDKLVIADFEEDLLPRHPQMQSPNFDKDAEWPATV